jgi:hypothetical protein
MKSEARVQQDIRLASAKYGTPLLRNNSGACFDDTGRLIRYGLGNDSAKINKVFKSADLIGIWPVTITPEMVGRTIGMFYGVECKPEGWKMNEKDERTAGQINFGNWVTQHGGMFRFATKESDVWHV